MKKHENYLSEIFVYIIFRELDILRESREKQKEMVESIVKQRDMYRILLAQSTPLPQGDDMNQVQ